MSVDQCVEHLMSNDRGRLHSLSGNCTTGAFYPMDSTSPRYYRGKRAEEKTPGEVSEYYADNADDRRGSAVYGATDPGNQYDRLCPAVVSQPQAVLASDTLPTDFITPSRNIACHYTQSVAQPNSDKLSCSIKSITALRSTEPNACNGRMGRSALLAGRGNAAPIECSDVFPPIGSQHVLEYGAHWRVRNFDCESKTDGLACFNHDGAGFFLSRNNQSITDDINGPK